jgi:toxin YoeB
MKKAFTDNAWDEFSEWWNKDRKIYKRIFQLIKSIDENPFSGIGKPEALKENLSGYWSRRINQEHRLVYRIENDTIIIVQCMYHY